MEFIEVAYPHMHKHFEHAGKEIEAFTLAMRLSGKVGKLSKEVMRAFGYASQEHLSEPSQLDSKLAGLVIMAHMLARTLDVNLEEATRRKIEMIKEEHNI